MTNKKLLAAMPDSLKTIVESGYAIWASEDVDSALRDRFDSERIPVVGVRHVRVWGLQVDDERVLPGHERTQIEDEEIWEVNLEAKNGSRYEVESKLLKPA
ncbi:MAG: hypothetical protein OEM50_01490 [Gammaproteobacteria bacterium]|nr:hypothetical protein [Gammaproteobacteria bacterium]MDH3362210.1 hypothetical protein [Gammaproteobacteria bacterium]MDH3480359.1 hypothetical protein [Gammaproteobacteria bacterium]